MSKSFDKISNYELLEKGDVLGGEIKVDFLCTLCEEELVVDRLSLAECMTCNKQWCNACAMNWYKQSRTCPYCRGVHVLYPFEETKDEDTEEDNEDEVYLDREILRKIFMILGCFSICFIMGYMTYDNEMDDNSIFWILDFVALVYLLFFIYLVSQSLCKCCFKCNNSR